MADSKRSDPYQSYRFHVEIDGLTRGSFKQASGLDVTSDVVQYREGKDPPTARKLSGLTTYSPIVLQRGITDDHFLWEWKQGTVGGNTERKNGSIVLFDDAGNEKLRWNFTNAWISSWKGPAFDASKSDVAIESVELVHEGVSKK